MSQGLLLLLLLLQISFSSMEKKSLDLLYSYVLIFYVSVCVRFDSYVSARLFMGEGPLIAKYYFHGKGWRQAC